jgi:hypothetical protein
MESLELKRARLSGERDFDFKSKEESFACTDEVRLTSFLERGAVDLEPFATAFFLQRFVDPTL